MVAVRQHKRLKKLICFLSLILLQSKSVAQVVDCQVQVG